MRVLATLLLFCLLAVGHAAPLQTQTLTGTVLDPASQPLAGVAVELRQGTAVLRRTTSDARGTWAFEKVAAGQYQVRMTLAGFVTTEVALAVGDTRAGAAEDRAQGRGGVRNGHRSEGIV